MLRVVFLIFNWSALALFTGGCALFLEAPPIEVGFEAHSRIFLEPYENVYRAARVSLATNNYPLSIENIDVGVIETEVIRGENTWISPHLQKIPPPGGFSYVLRVNVVKGKWRGRPSVQVTILKSARLQKDFFAKSVPQPTDGLEEKAILYRIERELIIERLLERADQRKSQSARPLTLPGTLTPS